MLPPPLPDRYELVRRLGAGGMGAVYLARDRQLDREVAIKLAHRPDDGRITARFRREARAMAAIEHPHVARLLDFGAAEGHLYMAQEYVAGEPPVARGERSPLAPMLDVAGALEAIHAAGVIHRDLKPDNLVRRPDGAFVLIDFGLARREDETALTATGVAVGTPFTMAPEVLRGEPASPASDFYAWGATLFALLEGQVPVPMDRLANWAVHGELELPWTHTPEGDPARRLVQRCLAFDPARRPTTQAQLEAIAAGGPVDPEAPTIEIPGRSGPAPAPRGPAPPRRADGGARRGLGGLALLTGIAAAALLGATSLGPRTSASSTGPAPPPRATAANAAAARDLDQAVIDLERFFGWRLPGRARDPSWTHDPVVRGSLRALADVRLPSKLRRARTAAERWLTALGPQGPQGAAEVERFHARVVGGLVYALALFRGVEAVHGTEAIHLLESGASPAIEDSAGIAHEELSLLSREVILGLVAASQGEARLVLEGFAVGLAQRRPRGALAEELMAALARAPASPLRPSLGMALDYANLHAASLAVLPCEDRVAFADFRADFLASPRRALTTGDLWRRRMRALSLEFKLDRACQHALPSSRAGPAARYLDQIEAPGPVPRRQVALGLEEARVSATRVHLFFDEPSREMSSVLARVVSLQRRFPPRPEERVPGT